MTTEHESPPPDGASDGTRMESDPPEPRGTSLTRALEQAREQRGSPSLWDAVAARLDSKDRQRESVAPMLDVLDQIRERVDDETWKLLLDYEWRSCQEIMAGVEVGLELGYDNGQAAALVAAEHVPGEAAGVLAGRLADLLGDTEAELVDVLLTLLTSLRATVLTAREALAGR